jgi:phenylalanyl-tRNA synthetase beta chain
VKQRLRAVGATLAPAGRNQLKVTAPSFRPDLNEPADLTEEVARLAGLAEIPAILPARTAAVALPDSARTLRRKIREVMNGCGLVEAKTIAFVAPADNEHFPGFQQIAPARVTNPLSAELSEMRTSLIPGLLAALRFNLNHEATALHLFELDKVFGVRDDAPTEFERLAGISYGDFAMGAVGRPAVAASFSSLKGLLETSFRTLSAMGRYEFARIPEGLAPYLHPGRSAIITVAGDLCGVLGELHPAEALKLDLQLPCMLFELDLPQLLAYGSQSRQKVATPPRYPAVRRDVALVVDHMLPASKVTATIASLRSPLLESAELFDVYEGNGVPSGKKSVAVACKYRGQEGTLTDDEVNRAHGHMVEQLAAQLGGVLRQ